MQTDLVQRRRIVNKQSDLIADIDQGWKRFWEARDITLDRVQVSCSAVGCFLMPYIDNEHRTTKSIQRRTKTPRQKNTLGMV